MNVILYNKIILLVDCYAVQCTVYIVHCILLSRIVSDIQCTVYDVRRTLKSIQLAIYNRRIYWWNIYKGSLDYVHYTSHIIHCTLYSEQCTLYSVQYIRSRMFIQLLISKRLKLSFRIHICRVRVYIS